MRSETTPSGIQPQIKENRVRIPVITVTGGAGFLGRALVEELTDPDSPVLTDEIRIFDRSSRNPFPEGSCNGIPVTYVQGDIRDRAALEAALQGSDAVVHLAAIVDWGTHSKEEVFSINVEGTANVIQACESSGVQILIHTSSLDAVCTGKPIRDGDESLPYPKRFPNAYCRSKAESEKLVSRIDPGKLRALTIRPTGIYGERDPYHISALLEMAEKGPYARIGNGSARCQHVYVGNVAAAILAACRELWRGNKDIMGKAYFITDSPAKNFFGFLDTIVEGSGYKIRPKNLRIPKVIMFVIGLLAEAGAFLIRPLKKINPKVSRFAVKYTCNDFILSGERARRDFGFTPKYSDDEAFARTVDYFRTHGPVVRDET
jgi:nucleoside-diphosphate-sugar epimerase